jgi:hypothetical protein
VASSKKQKRLFLKASKVKKLHDRWELDEVREKKPFRIGITIPLGKGALKACAGKIKAASRCILSTIRG